VSEIRVAALKDVTPGQPYPVEAEGKPLVLVRFDVRTGECLFPTRGGAVPSYPVRIDGDQILVELG